MDLQAKDVDYGKHYEQCAEIRKAFVHVLLAAGDLHASLFHTLGPVYTVYIGGFLQPLQLALGCKQIEYNKIEKCYEQVLLLVLLVLGRIESWLMEEMVHQMDYNHDCHTNHS